MTTESEKKKGKPFPQLSEHQLAAVRSGMSDNATWWVPVEETAIVDQARDVTVPSWVLDADVDYLYGASARFANTPHIVLHVTAGCDTWDKRYEYFDGGYYLAETDDGRAWIHYHGPANIPVDRGDDTLVWQTAKSEGFGGKIFSITMKDGKKVELVGPWHGTAPIGFTEASYHVEGKHKPRALPFDEEDIQPAWRRTQGYFGLYVKNTHMYKILKQFMPEWPMYFVSRYNSAAKIELGNIGSTTPKGLTEKSRLY